MFPMNSANHPSTTRTAAMPAVSGTRRHRRPSLPPKDFKDLSSFEKIVLVCCIPAGAILSYLEDEEPTYRSFTADNMRFGLFQVAMLEAALGLCVGSAIWCLLKGVALILRKVQRPKYYPQERMRRQALARERRRIRRRTTLNASPTADELIAQWAKVKKNPEEMIRFGSMLCDLEAYVDNSLLRNESGEIVGRNPGIRGWLNANCQQLAAHYKTVMGYKAMAEKFRQAVGLADPYPATLALEEVKNTVRKDDGGMVGVENVCQNTVRKDNGQMALKEGLETKLARGMACRMARRKAKEVLAESRRSQRGVRLALEARLAPEKVPTEVEREERRRQGLPARDGFARRFVQMMA